MVDVIQMAGWCQCCTKWTMRLRYDLNGDAARCPDCWAKIIVDGPHDDSMPEGVAGAGCQ